jgi:RNA polymerase sigma-70 factor (ECF subfamily)
MPVVRQAMEAGNMEATLRDHDAGRSLDGASISRMFEAHGDQVYRFCLRVLGCPHDAADALQDTFVNLARRQAVVTGDEVAARAYVFAAARNACFDLRRRARDEESLDSLLDGGADVERASSVAGVLPEQRAVDREAHARVVTALGALSDQQRTAWVLRELADLTYDEIAIRLGMKPNAVAQLLHRARGALRRALAPGGAL